MIFSNLYPIYIVGKDLEKNHDFFRNICKFEIISSKREKLTCIDDIKWLNLTCQVSLNILQTKLTFYPDHVTTLLLSR